ncbi:hypothetical protein, conserved [Angomonas deanei]|uniref:Uncharacterized protein n=1 Tax=Angomonas deanei TaxID=59799 RepID=A0A7G2C773_9TRYP|nr:hypothetical protein, conserved [Angomonas deanei]
MSGRGTRGRGQPYRHHNNTAGVGLNPNQLNQLLALFVEAVANPQATLQRLQPAQGNNAIVAHRGRGRGSRGTGRGTSQPSRGAFAQPLRLLPPKEEDTTPHQTKRQRNEVPPRDLEKEEHKTWRRQILHEWDANVKAAEMLRDHVAHCVKITENHFDFLRKKRPGLVMDRPIYVCEHTTESHDGRPSYCMHPVYHRDDILEHARKHHHGNARYYSASLDYRVGGMANVQQNCVLSAVVAVYVTMGVPIDPLAQRAFATGRAVDAQHYLNTTPFTGPTIPGHVLEALGKQYCPSPSFYCEQTALECPQCQYGLQNHQQHISEAGILSFTGGIPPTYAYSDYYCPNCNVQDETHHIGLTRVLTAGPVAIYTELHLTAPPPEYLEILQSEDTRLLRRYRLHAMLVAKSAAHLIVVRRGSDGYVQYDGDVFVAYGGTPNPKHIHTVIYTRMDDVEPRECDQPVTIPSSQVVYREPDAHTMRRFQGFPEGTYLPNPGRDGANRTTPEVSEEEVLRLTSEIQGITDETEKMHLLRHCLQTRGLTMCLLCQHLVNNTQSAKEAHYELWHTTIEAEDVPVDAPDSVEESPFLERTFTQGGTDSLEDSLLGLPDDNEEEDPVLPPGEVAACPRCGGDPLPIRDMLNHVWHYHPAILAENLQRYRHTQCKACNTITPDTREAKQSHTCDPKRATCDRIGVETFGPFYTSQKNAAVTPKELRCPWCPHTAKNCRGINVHAAKEHRENLYARGDHLVEAHFMTQCQVCKRFVRANDQEKRRHVQDNHTQDGRVALRPRPIEIPQGDPPVEEGGKPIQTTHQRTLRWRRTDTSPSSPSRRRTSPSLPATCAMVTMWTMTFAPTTTTAPSAARGCSGTMCRLPASCGTSTPSTKTSRIRCTWPRTSSGTGWTSARRATSCLRRPPRSGRTTTCTRAR